MPTGSAVWYYWTSNTTNGSATATETIGGNFPFDTGTTTGSVTTDPSATFGYWVVDVERRKLSKRERKEAARVEIARREAVADAERKRQAALARAEALLLQHLDDVQAENWRVNRRLFVRTPSGRLFRLGETEMVEMQAVDGEPIARYCVHAEGILPSPDYVLAKVLALRFAEDHLLSVANRH